MNFSDFYVKRYKQMVSLATRYGCGYMAEDVAQHAMMQAQQNWDKIQNHSAFTCRVVQNHCREIQRKRYCKDLGLDQTGILLLLEQQDFSRWLGNSPRLSPVEASVVLARVKAKLAQLRGKEVQAISMWMEGRKHEEIAQAMNLPLGTVKTAIHRGLKSLGKL